MRELMSSFLSNDSSFGRAMTWCGIVIAANVMFFVFSLPVVTLGASYTALSFTMMRAVRSHGQINPFREFWKGFKTNWKQGTIAFAVGAALAAFLIMDIRIARQAGGLVGALRIPLTALLIAEIIILLWLFPVIAAFEDTLPNLVRNSIFFALKRAWAIPVLLFFHLFSLYLSYTDLQMQPLYAFIWAFFGFGLLSLLDARLMIPEFAPYLPRVDEYGDRIIEPEDGKEEEPEEEGQDPARDGQQTEKSQQEILDEMRRLGM